jgi:hypothetical protein
LKKKRQKKDQSAGAYFGQIIFLAQGRVRHGRVMLPTAAPRYSLSKVTVAATLALRTLALRALLHYLSSPDR